jgi:hypothetical protein
MDGEDTNNEPTPTSEKKSSNVPMLLAGAAVCAVVAILFLWPGGGGGDPDEATRRGGEGGERGGQASERKRGGVQARGYDEADGAPKGRLNPAIQLPNAGMAPGPAPKPEEPPDFQSAEEEIAWYEKRLAAANSNLDIRKKAVERLPKARERAEQAPNPDEALAKFEQTEKRVQENLEHAEKQVAEIEKKLEALRK